MTKYLSDKLAILYTLLIIMVVYIHSYYLEADTHVAGSLHPLERDIYVMVCSIGICSGNKQIQQQHRTVGRIFGRADMRMPL